MNRILILTTILGLSPALHAQEIQRDIELDKFKDRCVKSYLSSVNRRGQSDLNGIYLRYIGDQNINPSYRELYFSPDYNLNVKLVKTKGLSLPTLDIEQNGKRISFYTDEAKHNGSRTGYKFDLEKVGMWTYELNAGYSNYSERNADRSYSPVFDEIIDFRADKSTGEPITVLEYERVYDLEKVMYWKNSELKLSCVKPEFKKEMREKRDEELSL
ncbi:hypothetical protein MOU93_003683 [Vibrio parahaemolyticus]|nr:hypothetical protein [Vibrio parahaemolyticus]